jgi:uncharacterized membrane protein YdbT with pleckstrin-like domain
MDSEKDVFEGKPSQKLNIHYFLLSILVVPIPWMLAKVIQTTCKKVRITNQRMIISEGVFSRRTEEVELYRVRDVGVVEPFLYRLVGIGNVIIKSTDKTDPDMVLKGFSNAHQIKDLIRTNAEYYRQNRKWGTIS